MRQRESRRAGGQRKGEGFSLTSEVTPKSDHLSDCKSASLWLLFPWRVAGPPSSPLVALERVHGLEGGPVDMATGRVLIARRAWSWGRGPPSCPTSAVTHGPPLPPRALRV